MAIFPYPVYFMPPPVIGILAILRCRIGSKNNTTGTTVEEPGPEKKFVEI